MGSPVQVVTRYTPLVTTNFNMEKMNSEEFKNNAQHSEKGYSFVGLIFGAIMVAVGYWNLPIEYRNWGDLSELSEEEKRDPCPNGAAYWMYIAGILALVAHSMNAWAKMYKKCAERDGKFSCGEKFGMAVNSFSTGVMSIVEFAMMIWGSVVVFGAWATWTDDYNEYIQDVNNKNYCAYTPMMTAFVILILKWVLIPCMIVLTCFMACCCACCCAMCAPKENTSA